MGYRLNTPVSLATLADALGVLSVGSCEIDQVSSFGGADRTTLSFSNALPESGLGAIIAANLPDNAAGIIASTPRLTFVRALQWLDATVGFQRPAEDAVLGKGVVLGRNVQLGKGVTLGEGTRVGHNVVIADGVTVGRNCYIKSNTVIGEDGFGMERGEDGNPIRFIHLGTVVIGDHVEIGSLSTICRGTLGNTIIEDHVKLDDHVHIAHNCRVRRGAIITASVALSGGVEVGDLAWIGPNASVLQKITLGSSSFIGLGAVVTHDVPDGAKVAGNPARVLPKRPE